jgi:hypothetical protein
MHVIALLLAFLVSSAYSAEKTSTVKSTAEIPYKATVDKGSVSGKIPRGTDLEVISEEGENLLVRFRQLTTTVPKQSTDFVAATENAEQNEATVMPSLPQAPQRTFTKEELNNAYYSARNSIKTVLKAPSTAKFSNPQLDPGTGATPDDAGRIVCKGFVEAQNSFGVPLRQGWVVWVQPEGNDQWRIVYAVLDGNVLRDDRKSHKTEQSLSAEQFLGMAREEMLRVLGKPIDVKEGGNSDDGAFKIYSFSNQKGKETFFTVWDSDGKITSGMYQGTWFSE